MNPTFHHFGVPTSARGEGETYLEDCKVFITDPEQHPYRIEFLRFEDGSPMPEALQKRPHTAWQVESLERAMEGHEVVVEPFDATDTVRVAFIKIGDALIELMEMH
jgi:hypothetical protein